MFYLFSSLISHLSSLTSHGTGSYPLPPQGLHDSTRLMVSQLPLKAPYFSKAWMP